MASTLRSSFLAENCWFLANEDTKEAVVIDLMDRLSDGYSEKQLQHLEEIFMACSRYEMAFWDMAWEMRR